MNSTTPSPSRTHHSETCGCHDCLSRRIHESTLYWTFTKYASVYKTASEHSRNTTVSGRPGTGRTLDMFLGTFGRILKQHVAKKADGLGYGPNTTMTRLRLMIYNFNEETSADKREKIWRKITKDCKQLLKFIERCVSSSLDSCDD